MFDLSAKPVVWIPIYWPGLAPSDQDGEVAKMVEHRIDVQVEILDRDELGETFVFITNDEGQLVDSEGKVKIDGDGKPRTPPNDYEAFKRVARDWRKVVSGGVSVPFTDENIRAILKLPAFPQAFGAAYLNAIAGKVEIREKN